VTRQTPLISFTPRPAGYVIEKADLDFGWTRPLPEEAFCPMAIRRRCGTFVECVREGKPPRETYEDGYIVNCILEAVIAQCAGPKWEKVR
jgi:hypothetical protein